MTEIKKDSVKAIEHKGGVSTSSASANDLYNEYLDLSYGKVDSKGHVGPKDKEAAISKLEQLVTLEKNSRSKDLKAINHLEELGELRSSRKEFNKAGSIFESVADLCNKTETFSSGRSYNRAAECFEQDGNLTKAESMYRKALAESPSALCTEKVSISLASCLMKDSERNELSAAAKNLKLQEAERVLKAELEDLSPYSQNSPEIIRELARAELKLNKHGKALDHILRAEKIERTSASDPYSIYRFPKVSQSQLDWESNHRKELHLEERFVDRAHSRSPWYSPITRMMLGQYQSGSPYGYGYGAGWGGGYGDAYRYPNR